MSAVVVRFATLLFACGLLPSYIPSCSTCVDAACPRFTNPIPKFKDLSKASCPVIPEVDSRDPLAVGSRDISLSSVELILVNQGDNVVMNCSLCDEQQGRNVQWRRRAYDGVCNETTFVIANFDCEDQGNYVCTVECGSKNVSEQWKSVWIRRSDPMSCIPGISSKLPIENKVSGLIGDSLTLPCIVIEDPFFFYGIVNGNVVWYRGRMSGNTPPDYDLCKTEKCGNYSFCSSRQQEPIVEQNLTIRKLNLEDSGWYTCQGFTFDGEVHMYYYVTVVENPETDASTSLMKSTRLIASLTIVFIVLISVVVIGVWWWWRRKSRNPQIGLREQTLASKFIYISYAEDTPKHLNNIKSMASCLSKSFDCILFDEHRNEAAYMLVPNWITQQIMQSSCVIVVCSPRYKGLTDATHKGANSEQQQTIESIDWNRRVQFEWKLIQSQAFSDQGLSLCVAVLWDDANESDIPFALKTRKCFRWPSDMFELISYLTDEGLQPDVDEDKDDSDGKTVGMVDINQSASFDGGKTMSADNEKFIV